MAQISKKSVLLTGAAGFIGFHTALALHARGDEVIGVDNFNSYYDPSLKRARAALLAEKGIEVIEGDLSVNGTLQRIADRYPHAITHLLHLAAQAGVRYSLENPLAYTEANVTGFLHVLELARELKKVPLIYASSSSVYGANTVLPYAENDRTDSPVSLYAATKKANEAMAHAYHHLYGFPTVGLRFFTVYGPWGRPDMAYYSFTEAIAAGKPIRVFASSDHPVARDFTYIDDIVAGILAALDRAEGFGYELFNLGNCHPEPLEQMISYLEELIGKRAERIVEAAAPGDVRKTWADLSKSRKCLGYAPKISLREGLRRFVEWYQGASLKV
ncbi:MAG: GDP-mannose 4,6-dehydratase [Chlamydiia bacterium]|nr:GDP-mannose 4,6-dehydratase [Chlamydiia bacterium]